MTEFFQCHLCKGEFIKELSDQEAREAAQVVFKPFPNDAKCVRICEDCDKEFIAWAKIHHPEWLR